MPEQNFAMKSGDSKSLAVSIVNGLGALIDVSSAIAIAWTLAETPASEPLIEKTLGIGVSVATSVVTVTLDAADTEDLGGIFYQELQITDGSGNVSTVLTGRVLIEGDVIT